MGDAQHMVEPERIINFHTMLHPVAHFYLLEHMETSMQHYLFYEETKSWSCTTLISQVLYDMHGAALFPFSWSSQADCLLLSKGILPSLTPARKFNLLPITWKLPQSTSFKLNIDGSSLGNPGPSGAGVVLRNCWGEVIAAEYHFIGIATNVYAETKALLFGLQLCIRLGYAGVHVESDSAILLQYLDNPQSWPWRLFHELSEINRLIASHTFHFSHVYREGNTVADALAKHAWENRETSSFSQIIYLPHRIRGLILLDTMQVSNIRIFRAPVAPYVSISPTL